MSTPKCYKSIKFAGRRIDRPAPVYSIHYTQKENPRSELGRGWVSVGSLPKDYALV